MERIVKFKIKPVLSYVEGYKLVISYIFFSDYNKNYVLTTPFPFALSAVRSTVYRRVVYKQKNMKKIFSYIFKYNDDSYYVGCLGSILQKRNLIDYISRSIQDELDQIKVILRYTALRAALRTNGKRELIAQFRTGKGRLITIISIFYLIKQIYFE